MGDHPTWLEDPEIRELLERFPVALALTNDAGEPELLNDRFARLCETRLLSRCDLRAAMEASRVDSSWQLVRLPRRDGGSLDARVCVRPFQERTLLVIDETPGALPEPAIDALRARVAELEQQSSTDRLTGAWNRAHLERIVETELARSERLREPLSLALLDIDHFKRINDSYGHPAGDSVLKELVRVVSAGVRAADMLFRWGGEEFVVLAASTGHRRAAVLAERLRARIAEHAFPNVGSMTVSIGVAERLDGESSGEWFARVDAQLYAAKHGGRNRVSADARGASDRWFEARGRSALELRWEEAYECGEPTIDDEHRELFALSNELVALAVEDAGTRERLDVAFDRLLGGLERHFRDEEAVILRAGYPHAEAHRRAHAALLASARDLRAASAAGKVAVGRLLEFLVVEVIGRHMLTADRDFFPFVARARAVAPPGP